MAALENPTLEKINARLAENIPKLQKMAEDWKGKALDDATDRQWKEIAADIDSDNQAYATLYKGETETEQRNAALVNYKGIQDKIKGERKGAVNLLHEGGKGGDDRGEEKSTPGWDFTNSKAYTDLCADLGIKAGEVNSVRGGIRIQSRPAESNLSHKDLLYSGTGSAGQLYRPQRLPNVLEILRIPNRIIDLFPTIPITGTNAVEYVRELTFTNNAAVVPEATSTTDDAALKPQSAMTFDLVTDTLEQIAHWIPASRQILADAAQLRAHIDSRLRIGLLEKLEARITAKIYAASGIGVQAVGSDTKLDATYKAAQKVRVTGLAIPESYIFHPDDWTDIRLAKDLNGNYLMGSPAMAGAVTLWSIPVVDTQNATSGSPLVGDWSMFGALYEREQIQTYVTDSHADFFVRNLIAILMELRALLAVYRANAACKITGF